VANSKDIIFNTEYVVIYLAAAGAGKTSVLMDEMTELLKVYRPDEIAFVTFTRKGVANGIERVLQANPQLSVDDLIHFRTLHALCFREIGLKHASIIGYSNIGAFNRKYGFNVSLRDTFEKQTADDRLLVRYDASRSSAKNTLIHSPDNEQYNRLINDYETFKKHNELVDFYDCLTRFKEAKSCIPGIKVAFIDEAQDLTLLQWEVCQIAFSNCEKIRIAGDDFQSLFTYVGASPQTLISLAERYHTVKLEISYRIPKAVYCFARGLTEMITDKIDKDFKPSKEYDGFIEDIKDRTYLIRRIQRDFTAHSETPYRWYLLFRNNCFIEAVADMLEQYDIPYHTSKGFCIAEKDLLNMKRYYNYQKEGYGSDDAREAFCRKYRIKDITADFTESNLIPSEKRYIYASYVEKYGIDRLVEMAHKEPFLLLSTIHRVKGGEADYVAVFLDCTKQVYQNKQVHIDEELRVLYVACTRAKLGVYLVASAHNYGLDDLVQTAKEMSV
jgi:superfamily I DNA/RNA helicase